MLDPQYIRDNFAQVKRNAEERNMDSGTIDEWLEVDSKKRQIVQELDELNRQKNELANLGKQGQNIELQREKGIQIKEKQNKLQIERSEIESQWLELINNIPNIHGPEVPVGKTDADNLELRRVGEIPQFDFPAKNHLELGTALDILDFETGAKVAGSQFYFLKGDGVRLEFALIQFGLDYFQKKGFTVVMTPDMAKSRFYLGTGYAPRGEEAQIYEISGEDLGLIGTAEITMAGMFADEVLEEKSLPLKFAAVSHCFRKESGAYGKYSKGLYRVHQFTKLEMFVYSTPEQSQQMHLEMLAIEEEIAQMLGIPYRVLEMCTGDLGAMASRKFDLEAWMPGRGDYGEITSTSNTTDFQARNLNAKYKDKDGKNRFMHTLNGTAVVSSRFPIAIMENYQQKDGSIKVPEVLIPYMGKNVIGKD